MSIYDPDQTDLVRLFLQDVRALETKYGLTIDHEDEHGAFLIHKAEEGESGCFDALDRTPAAEGAREQRRSSGRSGWTPYHLIPENQWSACYVCNDRFWGRAANTYLRVSESGEVLCTICLEKRS